MCLDNYEPSDDMNMPWVQCDDRKGWMHICCVPTSVDTTPIEHDEPFLCHECAEGEDEIWVLFRLGTTVLQIS